ncbi:monoheme cytochrome C [Galbibacter mesophilus]|uniref:monoheme cytochrome C n=1 Tax=Galbibacter mesophilus TaxID=379069 RepID=UPI00191EEA8E|nr:monoheme cytochrome C [Galbibacter mesophilus]MCM5662912.1 monoheme cytochrome C [Galbibacter mesophilus]
MNDKENFLTQIKLLGKSLVLFSAVIVSICAFILYLVLNPNADIFKATPEISETSSIDTTSTAEISSFEGEIKNGIHVPTGFVEDDGLEAVINNCTNCHSAKLVTQNRMSKENWLATIRWMQETQNLWDLGDDEPLILDYLATNYAPKEKGRRANLEIEDWYELKQ